MTSPIPFDDNVKDEMFDRGLDRLLAGDLSGLDDIEPEVQETTLAMVRLAHDAGWVGTEPGPPPQPVSPRRFHRDPVISKVAVILLVVAVSVVSALAGRTIEQEQPPEQLEVAYVSEEQEAIDGGTCDRQPRSATEIAGIVDGSAATSDEEESEPSADDRSFSEIHANLLQVTRDWNACLAAGQYDRAMAYESEHFIRSLAGTSDDIEAEGTDGQVATFVANAHQQFEPIAHGDGVEIDIYTVNWTRGAIDEAASTIDEDGPSWVEVPGMSAAEIWMVPVDPDGEWMEWPTVITFTYEHGRWMIDLHDREGSPATPVPEPGSR